MENEEDTLEPNSNCHNETMMCWWGQLRVPFNNARETISLEVEEMLGKNEELCSSVQSNGEDLVREWHLMQISRSVVF